MTLVLLHPLPLDRSAFASIELDEVGPVVVPDLYGLGSTVTAWAEAVLDLVGPGPLVVVGCSVGGSCALEMAVRAPERMRHVVLVGAKPGHRPEPAVRDAAVTVLAEQGMAAAWTRWWEPLFAPAAEPEVVDRARTIALGQDVDDVIRGVGAFHGRPDRSSEAEGLDVPITMVEGEHDPIARTGRTVAAGLRRGSVVEVPGAGHYLPLERPAAFSHIVAEVVGPP